MGWEGEVALRQATRNCCEQRACNHARRCTHIWNLIVLVSTLMVFDRNDALRAHTNTHTQYPQPQGQGSVKRKVTKSPGHTGNTRKEGKRAPHASPNGRVRVLIKLVGHKS
jgi:hypothetical protein